MPSVMMDDMYEYRGRFFPRFRSKALIYGHLAFHASDRDISARDLPEFEESEESAPSRCLACDCISSRQYRIIDDSRPEADDEPRKHESESNQGSTDM